MVLGLSKQPNWLSTIHLGNYLNLNLPTDFTEEPINEGYGHGVVEWIAVKIVNTSDHTVKLYTPLAEVDYAKFLQGKRSVHAENIVGAFGAFTLGAREAKQKFVLLSQEENNEKYPFNEWRPGEYVFEIFVKTSDREKSWKVSQIENKIEQRLLDAYFAGESAVLMNYKIDL